MKIFKFQVISLGESDLVCCTISNKQFLVFIKKSFKIRVGKVFLKLKQAFQTF